MSDEVDKSCMIMKSDWINVHNVATVAYSELQPLTCTGRGKMRKEVSVIIASGMTQILKISSPRGISV
jgi:hypothetical protein